MPIKIFLSGFPEFMYPRLFPQYGIEFFSSPSMSTLMSMSTRQLLALLESFDYSNHVVFRLSGENPNEFIKLLKFRGLLSKFQKRNYTVSFWTMDSHHLWRDESLASKYFDFVFVAHSPYLSFFDSEKVSFLPCSFSLASSESTGKSILNNTDGKNKLTSGVCAPFNPYPWQKRNFDYLRARLFLEKRGVPNFFGVARGGIEANKALIAVFLSHKIVLNLSLKNDLNMRNFEALSMNRLLVTNKVPDHEILSDFSPNIIFLRPNLSNLEEILERALSQEVEDISKKFLSSHHIEQRLGVIVKKLTGQDFSWEVNYAINKCENYHLRTRPKSEEYKILRHPTELLIGTSGWLGIFKIGQFFSSFRGDSVRWSIVLKHWLTSFSKMILAKTVGKSTSIRAAMRILGVRGH